MGIRRFIYTAFFLALSLGSFAQTTIQVEVVKGNTVYNLAKKYHTSVDAIYEANPKLTVRNLLLGETIVIPIPATEVIDSSKYTFHTVLPLQSVYGISRQYGITDSVLMWHNPELTRPSDLQSDQVLKIPRKDQAPSSIVDTIKPVAPEYEVYHVRRHDSPEKLVQLWGLPSLEAFYSLNPDAKVNWHRGLTLVKPKNESALDLLRPHVDSVEVPTDTTLQTSDSLNVACILPFLVEQYINEGPGKKRSELAFSYRQGIELAIQEFLADSTKSCKISFYDSKNNRTAVSSILDTLEREEVDLLLGPLYSSKLMQVVGSTLESKAVNMISKQEMLRDTEVWNDIVSQDVLWTAIRDEFERDRTLDSLSQDSTVQRRLIIAGLHTGKSAKASRYLQEILMPEEYILIEGDDSWEHNEELLLLDTTVVYDLVITENDPAYILDVLRNLRASGCEYHWFTHEFQALDNGLVSSVFAREQVTLFTSNFVDYSLESTSQFVLDFRKTFGRHPDKYAMEAYDNAKFHLLRLSQGTLRWKGTKKGFDFSQEGMKRNQYFEKRQYKNLGWELIED